MTRDLSDRHERRGIMALPIVEMLRHDPWPASRGVCHMATKNNLLRGELKRMGCPYWPDPADPRAVAWLEGNQAGVRWAREELAARAA